MEQLDTEAKRYVESKNLTSRDLGNKSVERPKIGYYLTLRLTRTGKQILRTNSNDIAIIRTGDKLEMSNFNRYVKRALRLDSKGPVVVTVSTNKKGMDGVRYKDSFMPFDALRGYVGFKVIELSKNSASVGRGEFTSI